MDLSVKNRPKLGRKFVWPFYFFSAPFEFCGRTIGQLELGGEMVTIKTKTADWRVIRWYHRATIEPPLPISSDFFSTFLDVSDSDPRSLMKV